MNLPEAFEKLIDDIGKIESKAAAFDIISLRTQDAQKYCQTYIMPEAWGKNVWHAVLDDAIKMRKRLEELTRTK